MAIVGSAQELARSGQGDWSEDKRNYTRRYLVTTNNLSDGEVKVLSAAGLPRFGYQHPEDFSARVTSMKARRLASASYEWEVEIKYEAKKEDDDNDDPLFELPEISTTYEFIQEPVTGTFDESLSADNSFAEGITNSAGEIFDPALMREVPIMVLTISRNEDTDTPIEERQREFIGSINQKEFWGWPAHAARLVTFDVALASKTIEQGEDSPPIIDVFYKVTYKFKFKPEGQTWDAVLLDRGSFYWENGYPSGDKIEFITDKNGQPYLGLLDGDGGQLSDGADAVFLDPKQIYKEKDFDDLDLPKSFKEGKPSAS